MHRKLVAVVAETRKDLQTKENNCEEVKAAEDAVLQEEQNACCCSPRRKERDEKEYKDLIHRLNRIEGQIRGIRRMVENSAYCPDILNQTAAATSALNSFSKVLLSNHIRTCVMRDVQEGKEETVDELIKTLGKLMK